MRCFLTLALVAGLLGACADEYQAHKPVQECSYGRPYRTTRCSSCYPPGTVGWANDCTLTPEQQLALRPGLPLTTILSGLGSPDKVSLSTCGQDTGRPWGCKILVYGGCVLWVHSDLAGEPLNSWSCQ